ncbi:hypothetical protein DXB46_09570 [Lachnospiraceae bacterium OM04-12BH]|nr:hypothetical protein DXB46_09570 [Lachnospiraceae bacterium OM04-12BH]
MLPGAAIFFYLHDIELADILHSTQKNYFNFTLVPFGTSFRFSPDIFAYYFSHHSKEDLIFMSDNQNNFQLPERGALTIPMTNDYLFRALLQRNNKVLTGLIASLLHLSPSEISSVEITNPIVLGESTSDKTFFLDIRVVLNQNTLINLEMQVINEHNWPERSLSYLCREFYATYKLLNVKNHTVYSDKLQLSVLDLTQIHLATDEDKACHIDFWASLFKARTWEELHMLSQNNEYLKEASETVYHLTQEEKIRLQCQAREDYYRRMKGIQEKIEAQEELLAQKDAEIAALKKLLAEK